MKKEKTYNGNLNIGEKIVSVDTNHNWAAFEIDFSGKMEIESLLPDDYIVKAGRSKIVIVKLNKREESLSELFKYKGATMITRCMLVTPELESIILYINNRSLQLWNTLMKSERVGSEDGVQQDWAYLGENWEDIDFDGNNNKQYYTYRKTVYDKETKKYIKTKELRKK